MHDMWVWCIGGMLFIGVNLSTWSKISSSTTFRTTYIRGVVNKNLD